MSHFCGLVILTPEYEKELDDAIEKYSESIEVPEYLVREVSVDEKKNFVKYYTGKKFYTKKSFEKLYAEKGADWNSNNWKKNEKGVWQIYSTYNPDSKWDWWCLGGRWTNCIKTKKGEFVDECTLGEIDFKPYPEDCYEDAENWKGEPCKRLKEEHKFHYAKGDMPFCIIIDGVWYERGEMGWWAMVSNEKTTEAWENEIENLLASLPENSDVYNVDFHI